MVLYADAVRGRRQPPQRVLRQPPLDALVNRRVVEEVQVVEPSDMAAVLGRERDAPAPALARRAGVGDEEVADRAAWTARLRGKGRRDEAVGRRIEERALPAAIAQELVRVAVAPVALEAAAEPKVLDARAAAVEEQVRERTRLGQAPQRPVGDVRRLLERRAQVRGAEADHVADPGRVLAALRSEEH